MNRYYFLMVYVCQMRNGSWGYGNSYFDIPQNAPNKQDLEYLRQYILETNPNFSEVVIVNVFPVREPDDNENKMKNTPKHL